MDNPLGKFGPEYAVLAPHTIEAFSNYYEPTLEELIEKCDMCQLTRLGDKNWKAENGEDPYETDGGFVWVTADTPKDAVIALYIALNKK